MEQYSVTGMSCAACSSRVEKAVSKVPGVTSCSVSLLTNSMGVEGTATSDAIISAVEAAGYHAEKKGTGTKGNQGSAAKDDALLKDTETPKLKKRLFASVGFLLVLMYFSMGHMMWNWPLPSFFAGNNVAMGLLQLLLTVMIMVINQKFFISGFKGLLNKSPNMDTLVALGSTAAFGYSTYALFAMTYAQVHGDDAAVMSYMHEFYFESAAMILTLITVGKMLEARSKGKTTDALKSLIRGEIPLNLSTLKTLVFDALLLEWKNQKETALQVFLLVIVAALVLNFTDLMEKNGTALISFFMMYLMLAAVLMKGFTGMSRMTDATLGRVNGFMKALVPSYFAAAVFAGNSVGGLAFYESAILLIAAVQWVQRYLLLPGVQLYVLFLLLDHLSKDDRLSHLAELVRTVIEWAMKSMTAAAIGFQVIQGLILPAVDGLKNTAVSRTVSAIPGIGNLFGSVTDTVLGSAVLLKNAVGVCGMIAVLILCLAPVCRLAFCTLIYKAMAALVQPVGDKRLNECVAAVAEGVGLLLKIMVSSSMLFFLTIAIVTASLGK